MGKSRFSQKKFYNINYWFGDFWAIVKKYILCKKAVAILWATSGNLGYLLFQHLVVQKNQLGQKCFIVLLRSWLPMISSEFLEGRKCLVSIQKTSMSLRIWMLDRQKESFELKIVLSTYLRKKTNSGRLTKC